jgi:hypothetical protein
MANPGFNQNNFGTSNSQTNDSCDNNSSEKKSFKNQELISLVSDDSVFGRYYLKICEILKSRKVPASRLPTREHFMSRLFTCLDKEKLEDWLTRYIEVEVLDDESSDEEIEDSST